MNKEPAETITLTPKQIALVHDFIFGPAHLACNSFSLINGYTQLIIHLTQAERLPVFTKLSACLVNLSNCLATAEARYKRLADQADTARIAVQAGTFNPHCDGEFSGESFYGLRRPTTPVSLNRKELEEYFRRFGDWARSVTTFVKANLTKMARSAKDFNLSEVPDETKSESDALWEKQKSLIAEFNTMCGIERRELNQAGEAS